MLTYHRKSCLSRKRILQSTIQGRLTYVMQRVNVCLMLMHTQEYVYGRATMCHTSAKTPQSAIKRGITPRKRSKMGGAPHAFHQTLNDALVNGARTKSNVFDPANPKTTRTSTNNNWKRTSTALRHNDWKRVSNAHWYELIDRTTIASYDAEKRNYFLYWPNITRNWSLSQNCDP